MQYRLVGQSCNAFGQAGKPHEVNGMVDRVVRVHFPAYDFAAVQIQYQVQGKRAAKSC